MAARFYLHRRAEAGREKRLRLIVYRGGRQIPVTTPVAVRASHWSQKMQRVKKGTPGAVELNAELERLRNEADALALAYPDDSELKEALLVRLGRAPAKTESTLLEHFEGFLAFKGGRVKENTMKVFRTLHEHLKSFLQKRPGGSRMTARGVGPGFMDDFQSFLLQGGLGNNSTNKNTSRLRSFFRWLEERGEIDKAPSAKPLKTARSHVIRLDLDELARLQTVDLSGQPSGYRAARELFLFCCYSGQRIGDVIKMRWDDIQNGTWYLREEKTGVVRRVPLVTPALEILEQHREEKRPLPKLSIQKLNDYVKVVGRRAGITAPVKIRSQKGGKIEEVTVPKFTVLTSHAGRRTFVSLMMESGVSAKEMLGITHADLRSLRHYAGASEDHLRKAMTKVFEPVAS